MTFSKLQKIAKYDGYQLLYDNHGNLSILKSGTQVGLFNFHDQEISMEMTLPVGLANRIYCFAIQFKRKNSVEKNPEDAAIKLLKHINGEIPRDIDFNNLKSRIDTILSAYDTKKTTKVHHQAMEALKHGTKRQSSMADLRKKRFAGGHLAATDLLPYKMNDNGQYTLDYRCPFHDFDNVIIAAYSSCIDDFKKDPKFLVDHNGSLFLWRDPKYINQAECLICSLTNNNRSSKLSDAMIVTYAGIDYLASLDNWKNIADGKFNRQMAKLLDKPQRLNDRSKSN